jgi:hypothetical protein
MLKQGKLAEGALAGLLLASLILIAGRAAITQAQDRGPASIGCSTFNSGQANNTQSNMTLAGALGQWVGGKGAQGASQLNSGFWPTALEGCGKHTTQLFLPYLLKSPTTTHLLLKSIRTGGINPVEIRDPENNNELLLICIIAPNEANSTKDCGYFNPVGTYTLIAHTARCGVRQGTFHDALPGATVTREVFCN